MSTVYEARHRNGKLVAVKILHPHLAAHPRSKKRFLREGFLANQVGHPGAVSVLDDDVDDDGTVFLVMELLHGETLAKRIELQGKLGLSEVLAMTEEILGVLVAAHEKGIVHRDLKPGNIFLTTTGEVKVLDFGIARLRQVAPRLPDSFSTQLGGLLGTPGFMAPEQARGAWDEVDGRTDLWALGALMFNVLTGRAVHRGSTPNELMIAAATQAAPPVGQCIPLPVGVAEIIDRALRLDPDDRWPDASTMRGALARVWRDSDAIDSIDNPVAAAALPSLANPPGGRPRFSSRQIAWMAGFACVIVLALAARSPEPRAPHLAGDPTGDMDPPAISTGTIRGPFAGTEVTIHPNAFAEPSSTMGAPVREAAAPSRPPPLSRGTKVVKEDENTVRRSAPPRPVPVPEKAVVAAVSDEVAPAASARPISAPPAANLLDQWQ